MGRKLKKKLIATIHAPYLTLLHHILLVFQLFGKSPHVQNSYLHHSFYFTLPYKNAPDLSDSDEIS